MCAAIEQLSPDLSKTSGLKKTKKKKQYLPGQTQNQYPPSVNTVHRPSDRSANDVGSRTPTKFSGFTAEVMN